MQFLKTTLVGGLLFLVPVVLVSSGGAWQLGYATENMGRGSTAALKGVDFTQPREA